MKFRKILGEEVLIYFWINLIIPCPYGYWIKIWSKSEMTINYRVNKIAPYLLRTGLFHPLKGVALLESKQKED